MPVKSTLKRTGPGLGPIEKAVARLAKTRLLVGVPGDAAPRPAVPGQKGTPPSNALVGYIMETGDAEMNIPARPFLRPGVRAALPEVQKGFHFAVVGALSGRPSDIAKGFEYAGSAAVGSVKATMQAGGFAPLAQSTIEARARRKYKDTGRAIGTKSSRDARSYLKLQAEGTPEWALQDAGLATPLLDTRSLYGSIQYIVKEK